VAHFPDLLAAGYRSPATAATLSTLATINGDLTFSGAAYAQVYNVNTLSGTIHMSGTSNGIQLRDGNAKLTVNSGGKIHGYGQVFQTFGGATLTINGTLSADVAAQTLALNNSNITGKWHLRGQERRGALDWRTSQRKQCGGARRC